MIWGAHNHAYKGEFVVWLELFVEEPREGNRDALLRKPQALECV